MFNSFKFISRLLVVMAIALLLPTVTFGVFAQEGTPEAAEAVAEEIEVEDEDQDEEVEVEDEEEEEDVDEDEEDDEEEGEEGEGGPPEDRGKPEKEESGGQGLENRSDVANAVHELLELADRSGGIGEQIREVARAHSQDEEEAEEALDEAKERGKVAKFFIGPNYKQLNKVEENLEEHNKRFAELEQLQAKLESKEDSQLMERQLEVMEQSRDEMREEVKAAKKGFSLFGWLNRWISK